LNVLVRQGLRLDLDPDLREIGRVAVEAVAVDPADLPDLDPKPRQPGAVELRLVVEGLQVGDGCVVDRMPPCESRA
jgi:hypothetical protein